ncbi:L-galactono-1,4-lactone dehydorogenase [Reticulomyxa filosa]|uniref:L-galactono-1,4-lactone dehydorogenase n=1 Tax=Reticulomyxa filosa TaxID=46433 RepID=X6MC51_RETFI|nr:L-galactono-1,4-lactone dehydorogenase [Reticulomyxa filosa]|eukprot:ETO11017.1 L-galactono-1,4-lactone dehydorogenase [Reticulomyxa filosa]
MIGYNVCLYQQSYLYGLQDKQAVDILGLRKVTSIVNYTNTCRGQTNNHFETQNLKAIIQYCHDNKLKIRPVGSMLSPNGIGLSTEGIYFYKKMEKKEKGKIFLENKRIFKFFEPLEKKISK